MKVQILTPEEIVLDAEVDSIKVPGLNGSFQMLNDHAPIVSVLGKGMIELHTHSQEFDDYLNMSAEIVQSPNNENVLHFPIQGGVLELNNNVAIILID